MHHLKQNKEQLPLEKPYDILTELRAFGTNSEIGAGDVDNVRQLVDAPSSQNTVSLLESLRIGEIPCSSSSGNNSDNKNSAFKDDTRKTQQECNLLRKLLASESNADVQYLSNMRAPHRPTPSQNLERLLAKRNSYSESLSFPTMYTTSANTTNNRVQLLRKFGSPSLDIMARISSIANPNRIGDQINIFGAMAVSLKAELLQSCAAAILNKRAKMSTLEVAGSHLHKGKRLLYIYCSTQQLY